jgi:hypothetical protein
MIFRDKDKPMLAKLLVYTSLAGVFLAGLGALGYDLYLASTQWLLVSVLLAVWGIFLLLEAEFRS